MSSQRTRTRRRSVTAVEVSLAVLALAAVAAVGVPTLSTLHTRSQDQEAKATLRTALTAAEVVYHEDGAIDAATPDALAAVDASITFENARTASTDPTTVSVAVTGDGWAAASRSRSGTCYLIRSDIAGELRYGTTTGSCTGNEAGDRATAAHW